jgi:hypothetical protein
VTADWLTAPPKTDFFWGGGGGGGEDTISFPLRKLKRREDKPLVKTSTTWINGENKFQLNFFIGYFLPDKMNIGFNVFHTSMEDQIKGQSKRSNIITPNRL